MCMICQFIKAKNRNKCIETLFFKAVAIMSQTNRHFFTLLNHKVGYTLSNHAWLLSNTNDWPKA